MVHLKGSDLKEKNDVNKFYNAIVANLLLVGSGINVPL